MTHTIIIPKTVEKRLKRVYNVTAKKQLKTVRKQGKFIVFDISKNIRKRQELGRFLQNDRQEKQRKI